MSITITKVGKHKLYRPNGTLISQHNEIPEAYEAASKQPPGKYKIVTAGEKVGVATDVPRKTLKISREGKHLLTRADGALVSEHDTVDAAYISASQQPAGTYNLAVADETVEVALYVTEPPVEPPVTWTKAADENKPFQLTKTAKVRYGAGTTWTTPKAMSAGTIHCDDATFGDPIDGVMKSCQVDDASALGTVPPVEPPMGDVLRWEDPATWPSGKVPVDGESVTIPMGKTITLASKTARIKRIDVMGKFDLGGGTASWLLAEFIMVHPDGDFGCGSPDMDYMGTARVTFTGKRPVAPAVNDGTIKGLMRMPGGRIAFYGDHPEVCWTELGANALAGTQRLELAEDSHWPKGTMIVVGPTDFDDFDQCEVFTLTADAAGKFIDLDKALKTPKWGVEQYATDEAPGKTRSMSYTPGTITLPDGQPDTPTKLNERACVGVLSHKIIIEGEDDQDWKDFGFGGHMMCMGKEGRYFRKGVMFQRMGQAGTLGRYADHLHLLSVDPATGNYLGDVVREDYFIECCSIYQCSQRFSVLHGTCGAGGKDCVFFDTHGHGLMLEDGSEQRNEFEHMLILGCKPALPGMALKLHEVGIDEGEQGVTGIWMSHPNNKFTRCASGSHKGPGAWLTFATQCFGASALVKTYPSSHQLLEFSHNKFFSNRGSGWLARGTVVDEAGNVSLMQIYMPTDDNTPTGHQIAITGIVGNTSFKNIKGGYVNRTGLPDYKGNVFADNDGTDVSGSTLDQDGLGSFIRGNLFVGHSLNDAHKYRGPPYPYDYSEAPRMAMASYHDSVASPGNIYCDYPMDIRQSGAHKAGGGCRSTSDYYTDAQSKGNRRNTGNRYNYAFRAHRRLPPNLTGEDVTHGQHFTFAGALENSNGVDFDSQGRKGWWVFNRPFFTHGATIVGYPEPANENEVLILEETFGFQQMHNDFDNVPYMPDWPYKVSRLDAAGNVVGTWEIREGKLGNGMLTNMRHVLCVEGGIYLLEFPGKPPISWWTGEVTNLFRDTDNVTFGIGGIDPAGAVLKPYHAAGGNGTGASRRDLLPAASFTEMRASKGTKFWHDVARQRAWVNLNGGLPYPYGFEPLSARDLYRPAGVYIGK